MYVLQFYRLQDLQNVFDFCEEDEDDVFNLPKLPVPDVDEVNLTLKTTSFEYVRLAEFAADVFAIEMIVINV